MCCSSVGKPLDTACPSFPGVLTGRLARAAGSGQSQPTQSGEDSGEGGAPSPYGPFATKQSLKRASKKRDKLARRTARASGAPAPAPAPVQTALGFGAFEAHTSGFGSRMLLVMGYGGQGTGLGREGRGIAEPIAVDRWPKLRGLGAT